MTDLAIRESEAELVAAPVTLFRTDQPGEVVARATETANALAGVIDKQKLFTNIQGRKHVRVEGWSLLGTMLGVFPVCVWTRKTEDGFEARVEARTRSGEVVGAAEAQCDRTERQWANRDAYALRSMAQTRATSKALRQPLGFVMSLAGFAETPAEEMPAPEPRRSGGMLADGMPGVPEADIEDATFTAEDGKDYELVGSGVQQAEPVQGFQAPEGPRGGNKITEPQNKLIHVLRKKLIEQGGSEDALNAEIQLAYEVQSLSELTRKEASDVITGWKKRAGEA